MNALQTLIDAVALGAIYALVAIGLALVFGVMRLVNFAHGELITAGGYTLALTSSWPLGLSILACFVVCIVLAVTMEKVAFRPLRGAAPTTTLIATFAVAFTLEAVWLVAFGPQGKPISSLTTLNSPIGHGGSLNLRWVTVVMIVTGAVLLLATGLFLNRTSLGLQMRAAAVDFRTARLLGVRADVVISFSFVLAGIFAAVVAILLTVQQPLVTPQFGLELTILALVGVVVGGLDRLWTATLGGFAIGFGYSALGAVLSSGHRVFLTSFIFLLVILVLLLRPAGLFAPFRAPATERV
jgi:branched-chain amino acid transport system permease protein